MKKVYNYCNKPVYGAADLAFRRSARLWAQAQNMRPIRTTYKVKTLHSEIKAIK